MLVKKLSFGPSVWCKIRSYERYINANPTAGKFAKEIATEFACEEKIHNPLDCSNDLLVDGRFCPGVTHDIGFQMDLGANLSKPSGAEV